MRMVLSAVLTMLLATCPGWCAAAACDRECHAAGGSHSGQIPEDGHSPGPLNDDGCICSGAVLAGSQQSTLLESLEDGETLRLAMPAGWDRTLGLAPGELRTHLRWHHGATLDRSALLSVYRC